MGRPRRVCRPAIERFFPLTDADPGHAAAEVCRVCEVRRECLDYGLRAPAGIWGGLNRNARRALILRHNRRRQRERVQPLKERPQKAYSSSTPHGDTTTTGKDRSMPRNATTPAPEPEATTVVRAPTAVSKDGTHTCPSCKGELPVTRFPTVRQKDGTYVRSTDECRSCRDARRAAARAAKK